MALSNLPFALVSMILLAGSIVLMFFVILAGVTDDTPFSKTYFLRADTSGITGARALSQWTYFRICGAENQDCGPSKAALPFGYAWSANPANAPEDLVGGHGGDTTSTYYFYMWRFGWVFYIMALFFTVVAWVSSFLAFFGRLGSALSGFLTFVALFWHSLAASLMTVTFVKARNRFHSAGRDASVGKYAFGFTWGAWAALFLAGLLFLVGFMSAKSGGFGGGGMRRNRSTRSQRSKLGHDGTENGVTTATGGVHDGVHDAEPVPTPNPGFGNGYGFRRVKDEYA